MESWFAGFQYIGNILIFYFSLISLFQFSKIFCFHRECYSKEQLPSHPCLQMIANSEQILSIHASRRLLTYMKIREPCDDDVVNTLNMLDFREMYFALRDETRKEKRTKQAIERATNKAKWEEQKKKK